MGLGYFFFPDNEQKQPFGGGIRLPPANKKFVALFRIWLELQFISKRSEGLDKFQAEKELKICEKKMDWWYKRYDFDLKSCLPEIQKAKREWEMINIPDRWTRK